MTTEPFIRDPRFAVVMRKLKRALKGWRWCLIGGRATEVWQNPPQTPDVDVLVDFESGMGGGMALAERLYRAGLRAGAPSPVLRGRRRDLPSARDGDRGRGRPPIRHRHLPCRRGAVRVAVGRVSFPCASVEHVVVLKAQAAVDAGRPRDKKQRDRRAIRDLAAQVDQRKLSAILRRDRTLLAEETALLKFLKVLRP